MQNFSHGGRTAQCPLRLTSLLFLLVCGFEMSPVSWAAETSDRFRSVLIGGVPHVRQKADFCGEACAEMYLAKLGSGIDQDYVFDQAGLDPTLGRGCYTRELSTALTRIGFRVGAVWYGVPANNSAAGLDVMFRDLHADLAAGIPSIVCMHYDNSPTATEHFRLILGFDSAADEIIYHEPAVDRGAYRRMKRRQLLKLWPLKYDQQQWTVIRFRLATAGPIRGRKTDQLTNADYAQDILHLRRDLAELRTAQIEQKRIRDHEIETEIEKEKKAKEEGDEYTRKELTPRIVSDFQIVLQQPFVVVGDDSLSEVESYADGTIQWAVNRLKLDFFPRDPDHVIRIWLFKDKESYEQNTYDLFRRRPHTPFGYYSPPDRALIMNISTGGGTLVHEIVHPFMAANLSGCPSWFNEGLGSLFEQCEDRNGHIWGLTNWRLRGLHELLKDEEYEMPTFEELCRTTTREFYNEDPGSNYAQARYLCYYLQEKGLLVDYFQMLRKEIRNDPSGYETLKKILELETEETEQFQKDWTEFVLGLRF